MQKNGIVVYYPYQKLYTLHILQNGFYKPIFESDSLQAIAQKAIEKGIVYPARFFNCY